MARLACAQSVAVLFLLTLVAGCGPRGGDAPATEPETLETRADRLAHEILIVDTHVDVPYRLREKFADISRSTDDGDFDYPRAEAGGLDAPFMSIYVPASYQETGGAKDVADELIDMVRGFISRWPDKFATAESPEEIRVNHRARKISLPMGMENGAPLEDDLANVQYFFDRGIRYITLTHSENNQICDSSYAEERQWHGLSPFGYEVVLEMNKVGIMVDVSHVSDETFDQVIEVSRAPVIASHSSCRALTPGFERNMSDEMIRKLAEKGGVIHINFGSSFLSETANRQMHDGQAEVRAYFEEHHLEPGSPEAKAYVADYIKDHPMQLATVEDVADHIDHVVQLVGVDHVGIGSDFDGVGPTTPTGLEDVSKYPNLIRVLLERGYSDEDVKKIMGENTLRVWTEVQETASRLRAQG